MVEGAPILPVPENPTVTPEKSEDKESKKSKDREKEKKKYGILAVEKEPSKEREEKPSAEKAGKKSVFEKIEPVSAEKAPDEELGEEESKLITQETAEQMLAELPEVDEEAVPEEAAAELAAQEFLAEAAVSGDAEEALEKTAAKLEVNPEELAELPEVEELEVPEPEAEAESPDEEVVFDRRAESDVEDDEDAAATTAATPPPTTGSTGGSSGGSQVPPAPPGGQPPFAPLGGFGHPPGGGPLGPGVWNPNAVPQPAAANKVKTEPQYHETSPVAMALFGGIIGYLIGRRRGRIKTEKRLLPIQKKLETQVTDLQFELQAKEKKIRRIAAEKVRQEGPKVIEIFKKPVEKIEKQPDAPKAPEHIGQVIVTAEAIPALRTDKETAKADKTPEQITKPLTDRRIETINRAELLEISEKIMVEGSSLRQIYETHLIGEKGLRRLVGEHLRGGDLAKALRQEIVEREIDFERDPAMRDMAPGGSATGTGGAHGKATLDHMLEKAGAKIDNNEEAAYYKARADYEADQHHKQRQQRRLVDASLAAIITFLLAAIIYLAFMRG